LKKKTRTRRNRRNCVRSTSVQKSILSASNFASPICCPRSRRLLLLLLAVVVVATNI
jgi:hypothetical protein